ncbi:hypothetical protein ACJMK2_014975 [Sinanodonta woodiana]|uniref:Uncharacterized protein n=1 Tax=Sinanodonta woodiana TaxID=1069815 RepID=A0ABD3V5E6_SINWO
MAGAKRSVAQRKMVMPAPKRATHEIAPVTSPVGRVQPPPTPPIYVNSKVAMPTVSPSPAYGATAPKETYSDDESDGEVSLHIDPLETLDEIIYWNFCNCNNSAHEMIRDLHPWLEICGKKG